MKCTILKIGLVSRKIYTDDVSEIFRDGFQLSFFKNHNNGVEYYINKVLKYDLDKHFNIDISTDRLNYNNFSNLKLDIDLSKISKVGENMSGVTNGHFWQSTKILYTIDDSIFITKNSIYAIYDLSEIRDSKINKLLN